MASNPDDLTFAQLSAFLSDDFGDCLRWLLVGAVAWQAAGTTRLIPHQRVLGMYTVTTQARALYEFFYGSAGRSDDARAIDFVPTWMPARTLGYADYMTTGHAANKRIFHLVYGRSDHAGGSAPDEADHLKNQVLTFANELVGLTRDFVDQLDETMKPHGQVALDNALDEARRSAEVYAISYSFG